MSEWQTIDTAPKDGTHILAILYREATEDMDGLRRGSFSEVREIWFRPYRQFGMQLPWHAGDPFDAHDGMAPDHFGEDVPTHWQSLPNPPPPSNSTEHPRQRVNVPSQHEAGNGQATVQNAGVTVVGTERGTVAKLKPEDHGLPPYPTGDIVGPCVCGSWPGGPCLRCPVVPARSTTTNTTLDEKERGDAA